MANNAKQPTQKPRIEEVCQQISTEAAAELLAVSPATLKTWLYKRHEAPIEWQWKNGEVFFQINKGANVAWNKYLLTMWQIAKAQDDAMIYRRAIERFRSALP